MTPYIRALRAITAAVFQRVYRPVVWVIGGILLVILGIIIALGSTVNSWWFLGLIIVLPVIAVCTIVAIALWLLSQRLYPRHITSTERATLLGFSDKLLRIAEVRATPLPIMVAMIAKDVVRGRKSGYIEGLINDSTSLKHDVTEIRDLFI